MVLPNQKPSFHLKFYSIEYMIILVGRTGEGKDNAEGNIVSSTRSQINNNDNNNDGLNYLIKLVGVM